MKNFNNLNPDLVRHMNKATFVSCDTVDEKHELNWNELRRQAKPLYLTEEISAMDGSGLIVYVLKGK